ncbi:hypothetical protein [Streptomyces sp. WMMC897]|uniref:hypothetical protein n=1 Tax=Streptomyces sp. WMMC897 TaxID=3014782 RepID=UPI0022B60776|nr:hypothetical protein [Streptomyces sp. WMMC897]MCZ7413108.1 hypothetical protein [Streptomyces sp. WMMC897]MCZ7413150.1 hypothetical protein [Streptomyces sp. WMMC897]MCZ7415508.1 hypothetical protein [Streptomyces sp. WMMC897]
MPFELVLMICLSTVGGLLIWRLTLGLTGHIAPDTAVEPPALSLPDGVRLLVCESVACADETPHVVMPCGTRLCLACGHETPIPAG